MRLPLDINVVLDVLANEPRALLHPGSERAPPQSPSGSAAVSIGCFSPVISQRTSTVGITPAA